jgi:hypothetical protein
MSFTGFGSSSMRKKGLNVNAEGYVDDLTREDKPPMSLENFTLVTDNMIMRNDDK